MSTPSMLRQEPVSTPSFSANTMVGKLYSSRRREAVRPITPGFQPSPRTIRMRWAEKSKFLSCSSAAARISRSTLCRRAFSCSSSSAWATARKGSSWVSSSNERRAEPSRPPAFSRGAMRKAMPSLVSAPGSMRALSISAASPGRTWPALMRFRPRCTMARFSPVRETTSATVAMAARSMRAMAASSPPSACTSLKATPAPQSQGKG